MNKRHRKQIAGWDPVAEWYDGWMGQDGSEHHRRLAIPAILDLLQLDSAERVLDIGAGQGVLAQYVSQCAATYVGVDISPRLMAAARKRHGKYGTFLQGDARRLSATPGLQESSFDAVVFLLSIEDMHPLADSLDSAAWALKEGGRLAILMRHPCFRVPRQSGWGYDEDRRLQFRRVDRYLTPLSVPMKAYDGRRKGATISYHRPLSAYINELSFCGLLVECLNEITTFKKSKDRVEQQANDEIPLFLALRARKLRQEIDDP